MTRMAHRVLLAVEETLTGATSASVVRRDHVDEVPREQLPVIDINGRGEGLEESIERESLNPPALQRHALRFSIAAMAGATAPQDAAAAVRELAAEVEALLLATDDVVAVDGTSIEMTCLSVSEAKGGDTADALARAVMTWQATYYTFAGQPGVPA